MVTLAVEQPRKILQEKLSALVLILASIAALASGATATQGAVCGILQLSIQKGHIHWHLGSTKDGQTKQLHCAMTWIIAQWRIVIRNHPFRTSHLLHCCTTARAGRMCCAPTALASSGSLQSTMPHCPFWRGFDPSKCHTGHESTPTLCAPRS